MRTLIFALFVFVGFSTSLYSQDPQTPIPVPQNGDVNQDGSVNLVDVVYLLNHLYASGPPLPKLHLLADTGLDQNSNTVGDPIGLGDPAWPGQDADFTTGWWVDPAIRWVSGPSGTVIDTVLGLQWAPMSSSWMPWQTALVWCSNLTSAGHTDWRLPNIRELHTLANYKQVIGVQVLPPAFSGPWSSLWSSTSTDGTNGMEHVYVLNLELEIKKRVKHYNSMVMAVRNLW